MPYFLSSKKQNIVRTNDSLIFVFDQEKYGYFLDGYDPNMTEFKFRMRSLIFLFHSLDKFTDGFRKLKNLSRLQYLRKKAVIIFIIFLILLLPAMFSIRLSSSRYNRKFNSTMIAIGMLSLVVLSAQFLIIMLNQAKMERRITMLQTAKDIKRFLLHENYYWMYKHHVIFDVDRKLNIYLVFLEVAPIARKCDVNRDRCRKILKENNLLVEY